MHPQTYLALFLMMIMLTAGFLICELNMEDLQNLWTKLKRFIKVKHQ